MDIPHFTETMKFGCAIRWKPNSAYCKHVSILILAFSPLSFKSHANACVSFHPRYDVVCRARICSTLK